MKAAAEKATPGHWWTGHYSLGARKIDVMADAGWHIPKTEDDAAFIVASNPANVLALIADWERLHTLVYTGQTNPDDGTPQTWKEYGKSQHDNFLTVKRRAEAAEVERNALRDRVAELEAEHDDLSARAALIDEAQNANSGLMRLLSEHATRIKELEALLITAKDFLHPYAASVVNDNFSITVSNPVPMGYQAYCDAYFIHRNICSALDSPLTPRPERRGKMTTLEKIEFEKIEKAKVCDNCAYYKESYCHMHDCIIACDRTCKNFKRANRTVF